MPSAPKKQETTVRTVFALTLIALVSAGLLAWVNVITKEPIERAKTQQKKEAIAAVLPGFANDPLQESQQSGAATLYPAKDAQGQLMGAAVEITTEKGFGGQIRLLVGVDSTCQVTGYRVLEHKETPGLGDKASTPGFSDQFKGRSLQNWKFKVKKDGGDVDAITAATITSRAVTGAVEDALKAYAGADFVGGRCAQ